MENKMWLTRPQVRLMTIVKVALVLLIALFAGAQGNGDYGDDSNKALVDFYRYKCPSARRLVKKTIQSAVATDKGLPAALLRLSFHDCFVRGCDASILLDSNSTHLAEKDGLGNAFSVRGYETIDAVKTAVEKVCPGVVSCADIVALAALDAIVAIGGPAWTVRSGRRDGMESHATEPISNLPSPFSNYTSLVEGFTRKGLTEEEMVILSGGHTIGITHCGLIESRLYNSTGPNGVDPTLDSNYAVQLKKQCPFGAVTNEIKLDPTNGGDKFDSKYFTNVQKNKGVLISDAALITTKAGRGFVKVEAAGPKKPFFKKFASAMEKMNNIGVLTVPAGQIRSNCRFLN